MEKVFNVSRVFWLVPLNRLKFLQKWIALKSKHWTSKSYCDVFSKFPQNISLL